MAQNQPKKVGKYNRSIPSSKTSTMVTAIVVLIALIILAIIIF
jgi:hypothetical protein